MHIGIKLWTPIYRNIDRDELLNNDDYIALPPISIPTQKSVQLPPPP